MIISLKCFVILSKDDSGEPGSRSAPADSLSQLVDAFTLGPSAQSASRAVVAPDGTNLLPQPLSSTAISIPALLETEKNVDAERNQKLQNMEHGLEQQRSFVEDVDVLQAAPYGPLPAVPLHAVPLPAVPLPEVPYGDLPALPDSHVERQSDAHVTAVEHISEDEPTQQIRSTSNAATTLSETLLKDGSLAAPDSPMISQRDFSSHVRPALAVARREDVLVQELQAFDAALVKTFPNISPSAVNIIIQNATRRLGTLGCEIFREGEVSSDMMFLFSGRLDVHKRGQSKVSIIDCSSVVGHHSYLYHRPRSATVVVGKGPQCIYYNFSIDKCSNDVDVKSGLWHNSTARLISSKISKENETLNSAAECSGDLVVADVDIQQSPLSKRRMSALLGDESSVRRYTRDVLDLDYADSPPNTASEKNGSISLFAYDQQSPSESRSKLVAHHSLRQRPVSAVEFHSSRRNTSSASPVRPASSRSRPSLASSSISPSVYVHDMTESVSPRPAAAVFRGVRSSPAFSSPNRRLSIISRTKEAVQQQLSSSSSDAVSCILFSAAWLLCLTQLEKLRMPEPRHAVCR